MNELRTVIFGDREYRVLATSTGVAQRIDVRVWRYGSTENYWRRIPINGTKAKRVLTTHGFDLPF